MEDLSILVVEDAINFQKVLPKLLKQLSKSVRVDIAANYAEAINFIKGFTYDSAVIDMALSGEPESLSDADEQGLDLISEITKSPNNRWCGVVVLTAYGNVPRFREAVIHRGAYDLLDKAEFNDGEELLKAVRGSLFDARYRRACVRQSERYKLIIECDESSILGSRLQGPSIYVPYRVPTPISVDFADLSRRTNDLDHYLVMFQISTWRTEAKLIGESLYSSFDLKPELRLLAAQDLSPRPQDLWITLYSPTVGLGVPFELIHSGSGNPLALNHVMSRHLHGVRLRKTEAFRDFLSYLYQTKRPLQILIVAANSDDTIVHAELEAVQLAHEIKSDLDILGFAHKIELLSGPAATYQQVRDALATGAYDIFHYAGHGYFDGELPEVSGTIMKDEDSLKVLGAAALSGILAQSSENKLRFVYLSCCLGAQSADSTGSGDFHGLFEALVHADVPMILGYRWSVADHAARLLASSFYRYLWRTFSPGDALRMARNSVAIEYGRNDSTWAAPILLMQNEL